MASLAGRQPGPAPLVLQLFSRRWWWVTLLVIAAVGVMAGLGNWQLARLDQRRARNAQQQRMLASAPLDLARAQWPADLQPLHMQPASVSGEFDYAQQVLLKEQLYVGQAGVHLITPLRIAGTNQAVLVDRGWISYAASLGDLAQYNEAPGKRVEGWLHLTQLLPGGRTEPPPAAARKEWYRTDIAGIQAQLAYPLLPMYLEAGSSAPAAPGLLRFEPDVVFDDGPHMGYALQWFLFCGLLAVGYLSFVRRNGV